MTNTTIPAAVRNCYPTATKATIAEIRIGGEWIDVAEVGMELTQEIVRRLRKQGATAVNLTVEVRGTRTRRPDFQIAELVEAPEKPKAPSNDDLAAMTIAELFATHKRHPQNRRVWDALIAAVRADDSPARPGRLTAWDNGHSKGLERLTKKPRGAMRSQTWIRSRQTFSKTTYPIGGALPG